MARVTNNLRDAQALAEFSNLEPKRVEWFRNNYPDFVPQGWWDYQSGESASGPLIGIDQYGKTVRSVDNSGEKQWQLTQSILRHSWKHQFKDEDGVYSLVALITSVFNPDMLFTTIAERAINQVFSQGLPKGYSVEGIPPRPAFADFYGYGVPSTPFHRAVVYLFQNSWRARFCTECNKRFVAAEPKNKFCSETCSHNNRTRQKLKAWHAHKHEWRPARKKRQP